MIKKCPFMPINRKQIYSGMLDSPEDTIEFHNCLKEICLRYDKDQSICLLFEKDSGESE